MYRIGIISDTHGLLREEVICHLKECDVILHGGDVDRQGILDELKRIAPVYAVRGNVDGEWANDLPDTRTLELQGIKIFMIHNKKQIHEELSDKDVILYGHSHKYEEKWVGRQLWLNPGSCGAKRFLLPVTMAVLEVAKNGTFQVKRINLNEDKSTKDEEYQMDSTAILKSGKSMVAGIMKDVDQGKSVKQIAKKYHITEESAEHICRLYLTHPGVDVDGILNRIELGLR